MTAGNLQSHGEKLKQAGYLEMGRVLVGIFEVRWRITDEGVRAFEAYFQQMRALMERLAPPGEPANGLPDKSSNV